ncbi:MAG TPA: NAD(P)-binding protein, partial [Fimbriimonadaceae bacterium]|nr:NAD(P)-binding protein [Fimbriimonadaceae bacterium]
MAHYIVCGLGQVGYRVSDLILRLGEQLTVVTLDVRDDFLADVKGRGARVIISDARSNRSLIEAGLADAYAVIACTDSDLVNLEIALDTRRFSPHARIVTRLFDQTLARGLETTLGIHRALAMSVLASPVFAAAALGESIQGMFSWHDQTFVVAAGGDESEPCELQTRSPRAPGRRRWRAAEALHHALATMRDAWKQTHGLLRLLCYVVPVLAI